VGSGNGLVGRLLAIVDAAEVERTRARVLAAHAELAREGRPQGGRCYGFDYDKDDNNRSVRVVNPSVAEVVREIADKLVNGHSATSIAADLNARSVPPPQPMMRDKQTGERKFRPSARWHLSSVKYVISKPAVAGLRSHHGKITKGRWDEIIPEDRWRKAVRALGATVVNGSDGKQHKVHRAHQTNTRRWLLTGGIAVCAPCKTPLTVAHTTNGRAAYTCRKDMDDNACGKLAISPAEDVEALVVREIMLTVERSPRLLKAVNGQPDPKRGKLHAELTAAEDALRVQARRFGLGEITDVEWEAMAAPLRARASRARDGLAALPQLNIDLPPFDQIAALWDEMPLRQRRAFIERVAHRVEIAAALRKGYARRGQEDKRILERVRIVWRV
jgi:hypothetical protein